MSEISTSIVHLKREIKIISTRIHGRETKNSYLFYNIEKIHVDQ